MQAQIPEGPTWFIAQIVQEFTIGSQESVLVHVNYTLIKASDPETAYSKAIEFGKAADLDYENPEKEKVQSRFIGLRDLVPVYEALEDGGELLFEEYGEISKVDSAKLTRPKESLACFRQDVKKGED